MRYSQPRVGAKSLGLMAICALVSFGFATVSEAAPDAKPKPVVTTSFGSGSLSVEVNLQQMKDYAPHPTVLASGLQISIEQHIPTSISGSPTWTTQLTLPFDSESTKVPQPCCLYNGNPAPAPLGTLADVAIVEIGAGNFCSAAQISSAANSIRAVAVVKVQNGYKGWEKTFLGRSISMPNPCKPSY